MSARAAQDRTRRPSPPRDANEVPAAAAPRIGARPDRALAHGERPHGLHSIKNRLALLFFAITFAALALVYVYRHARRSARACARSACGPCRSPPRPTRTAWSALSRRVPTGAKWRPRYTTPPSSPTTA